MGAGGGPARPAAHRRRTCYGDLGDVVAIRLDASIVIAHSDKEHAAPTFKKTFGFHPLTAWCDNTGEALAVRLRPGNAGSNTAADHLEVLTEAIAQIPAKHRRRLLVTLDGAGASHPVVAHLSALTPPPAGRCTTRSASTSTGAPARRSACCPSPGREPALDAAGAGRADADVAEPTGLLRRGPDGDKLTGWPADMRVIVRREPISPGARISLFEQHAGKRHQVIATNTGGGQVARLEARHRVHARSKTNACTGTCPRLTDAPAPRFRLVHRDRRESSAYLLSLGYWTPPPVEHAHHRLGLAA